jgi:DNA-binding MarR family transcriptional regulator
VAESQPSNVQLMEQFRAVAHIVHNRTNAQMTAAGLSWARFRVLRELHSNDRMRMNELSAALGVVPRTVTAIIDALEKDSLVTRMPDPTDRRVTLLQLTDEGLRQLHQSDGHHEATAAELFEVLTADERRQLVTLLQRLQAAAE